jgi:hypothetical protein
MTKTVLFSVDKTVVTGDFEVEFNDTVALFGKPTGGVHAWRNGIDSCNVIGCPCPLESMTGHSVPTNEYAIGDYSIGVNPPEPGDPTTSNGKLRVGSGPGDPGPGKGHGPRHR